MECLICKKNSENYPCPFCGYDGSGSENPHYLEPGTPLFSGRYRVGQVVGAGGFGVTYSAWDVNLARRVAVKEYMPGEFSTRMPGHTVLTVYGGEKQQQFEAGMLKFHDESERLAKFTEVPGIVQIYDCFFENNTAYIVMEFLEGETLDERIKREDKIPVSEAIDIMIPVLDALTEVHNEQIIHRDIAPNNIFLTSDGKVKLLDFGAARAATGSHSKSLTVLYKEGFTAEEQYQSNGTQGSWTDVYSAAATLYKAITGNTPDGAMERRFKDKLPAPSKCGIKLPRDIDRAIMNALNVNYKVRTQTAMAFKTELTGQKKVKVRFQRTMERRIGRVPTPVWIVSLVFIVAIGTLITLQATGVADFSIEGLRSIMTPAGKVRMISVVNMDEKDAFDRLKAKGLTMVPEYQYSNDYRPDRVISQAVSKGTLVDKDSEVSVVVNLESKQVQVPKIAGETWDDAHSKLDEVHLNYTVIEQASPYLPGVVLNTSPANPQKEWQGQTVKVYVSKGLDYDVKKDYVVESVVGHTESEIRNLLEKEGIYLTVASQRKDMVVLEGGILAQTQAPGTVLKAGSELYVTVSSGLDTEARSAGEKLSDNLMKQYMKEAAIRNGRKDQILEEVEKKANSGDETSKAIVAINERRVAKGVDKIYPSTELNGAATEMARLLSEGIMDSGWNRHDGHTVGEIFSRFGVNPKGFHFEAGNIVAGISTNTSGADSFSSTYANPDYTLMGLGRYRSNHGYYYVFLFTY